MTYLKNFIYSPGGENESGNSAPNITEDQKDARVETPETKQEDKPIIDKIKDALQDWSNKDELDQEFDDTRV